MACGWRAAPWIAEMAWWLVVTTRPIRARAAPDPAGELGGWGGALARAALHPGPTGAGPAHARWGCAVWVCAAPGSFSWSPPAMGASARARGQKWLRGQESNLRGRAYETRLAASSHPASISNREGAWPSRRHLFRLCPRATVAGATHALSLHLGRSLPAHPAGLRIAPFGGGGARTHPKQKNKKARILAVSGPRERGECARLCVASARLPCVRISLAQPRQADGARHAQAWC